MSGSHHNRAAEDSLPSSSEGVPLLGLENKSQPQQASLDPSAMASFMSPPPMMMMMPPPPGNYGATNSSQNSNSMAAYAMAAAHYEYYAQQDPAVAAAAAAAMKHQMHGASPQAGAPQYNNYYSGYPPYPSPISYSNINMPYPTTATTSPGPPASRPPRHHRRSSSGKSPNPSPQNTKQLRKSFSSSDQYLQQQQASSSVPPVPQIYTTPSNIPQTSNNNHNNNNNYGSIMSTPMSTTTIEPNKPGVVYNAPLRVPPSASKVQPVMVRTNSMEKLSATTNKKVFSKKHHRRSNSDTPLRLLQSSSNSTQPTSNQYYRPRTGSMSDLPPSGLGQHHRRTNSGPVNTLRGRSFSTNSLGTNNSLSKPPHIKGHRRMDSAGSVQTYSSMMSQSSVVSNISKSAMFGGVDEATGRVQLHYPLEAVRLQFLNDDDTVNDDDGDKHKPHANHEYGWQTAQHRRLTKGHLYMYRNVSDYDQFDDYIRVSEDLEQGLTPQWESLGNSNSGLLLMNAGPKACACTCNHCNGCVGKRDLLPQTNYALPVGDSVYKAVVDEIASAHSMPCGCFFCGHHEDVSQPSIQIAVAIVLALLVGLVYVAVMTDMLA